MEGFGILEDAGCNELPERIWPKEKAVIVTHRMGSVRFCDKILVLEQGRLAGVGTHEELLDGNPVYGRLWHSQADMFM